MSAVAISRPTTIGRVVATEVVSLHGFAHGGEAVGRLPDGRAVFVAHAIPGETVRVRVVESRKRWARAELVDVLEASVSRTTPPCPYFGPGQCGGCRLQHIDRAMHGELLRQVVVDQLQRIGRIPAPNVAETVPAGDFGYRTRARFAVTPQGQLGFRRHASHEVLAIDRCLLLDDATQAARTEAGDAWDGADEVEVSTGSQGRLVMASRTKARTIAAGGTITEEVSGLSFRVSPRSFFQSNRQGAQILLALVRQAAQAAPGDTALDLFAGVGLFARGLVADGATVTAVEGSSSAADDARHNLGGFGEQATVVHSPVERALARMDAAARYDIVVADPPRSGAGRDVITALASRATRVIIIVACDPAALGRDAATLGELGWSLDQAIPVDQFAQTAHVEVVATFRR